MLKMIPALAVVIVVAVMGWAGAANAQPKQIVFVIDSVGGGVTCRESHLIRFVGEKAFASLETIDCGNGPSSSSKDQGFVFTVGGTQQETYTCTRKIGNSFSKCTNGNTLNWDGDDIGGQEKISQKRTAKLAANSFAYTVDTVTDGSWNSVRYPDGGRYKITRKDQVDIKLSGNKCSVGVAGWNQRNALDGKSHSSRLKRMISCSVS